MPLNKDDMRHVIVTGLKNGRTLMMDGAATPTERKIISELEEEGLVDVAFIDGEQYGAYKITWRQ